MKVSIVRTIFPTTVYVWKDHFYCSNIVIPFSNLVLVIIPCSDAIIGLHDVNFSTNLEFVPLLALQGPFNRWIYLVCTIHVKV